MDMRAMVRVALFAAIIAVLGLLPRFDLPIAAGVPVTAQTLGVMLAGLLLGARQGAWAVLLFLFVVALGAPFLAGGRGGLGVFFGPSVGYLVGWIFGAGVCGVIMNVLARARLAMPLGVAAFVAALIGGVIVVHAFGIPVLAWKAQMLLLNAAKASLVFVPGDLIKSVVAALVAVAAHRSAPTLFAQRS